MTTNRRRTRPARPAPGTRSRSRGSCPGALPARVGWLVVRQGGTAREHYATVYDRRRDARTAIRRHHRVGYPTVGPFKLRFTPRDPWPDGVPGSYTLSEPAVIDLICAVMSADLES